MKFKFLLLISCLTVHAAFAQSSIFQLDKLDSADFQSFIDSKKVIVVGEMHGTTEVPLFVLELLQQFSQEDQKLTVGLEINSNYQKDLDEYMKSGDFEKLIALDYFKTQDGRTSEAIGELIKGIRALKNVEVICFDVQSGLGLSTNERDSLMGVNLSQGYKEGRLIVLTGNLHANLKEGFWRPTFKSAIYHFNQMKGFDNQLISLNTYFGEGTYWNCMSDGCKERAVSGNKELSEYGKNYMLVYPDEPRGGYSGFLYFDKVSASRPLVVD
ncbi:ChaN family lipoprotein [Fulvivirga ligni]|uniref:ChaN family lipoprotein n=1 Tax=Fulvivirga ligni TaxID=2904246 RepID=UPI001F1A1082|nr:ChaN family lipoprotein [Fulvivirga ligni]UII21701.1 ChaN family lipoprotein [Fulvivirga ligni]